MEGGGRVNDDPVVEGGDMQVEETTLQPGKDVVNETQDDASFSSVDTPSVASLSQAESSDIAAPSISDFTGSFSSQLSELFGPRDMAFAPTDTSLKTFKLIGDNLDKNVKPCDMRLDNQTKSLHYFHIYALRDRIDLSKLNDDTFTTDIARMDVSEILPTQEDTETLKMNFSILIARVLKKHMQFFKKYGKGLETHIQHKYYSEMSAKSHIVSVYAKCCQYLHVYTNIKISVVLINDVF